MTIIRYPWNEYGNGFLDSLKWPEPRISTTACKDIGITWYTMPTPWRKDGTSWAYDIPGVDPVTVSATVDVQKSLLQIQYMKDDVKCNIQLQLEDDVDIDSIKIDVLFGVLKVSYQKIKQPEPKSIKINY